MSFIRRSYARDVKEEESEEKTDRHALLTNLESRLQSFSDKIDRGIIKGRLLQDVKLTAVGRQGVYFCQSELVGGCEWTVADHGASPPADLVDMVITVTTSGGTKSGTLKAAASLSDDIVIGSDHGLTALAIKNYFHGSAGVQVTQDGGALTFRPQKYRAPIGSLVSSSNGGTAGFTPPQGVAYNTWWFQEIMFDLSVIPGKVKIGEYFRVARKPRDSDETARTAPILRPGRMKATSVVGSIVEFDELVPGFTGGDYLYREVDNAVKLPFPAGPSGYSYLVVGRDQPANVWRSSASTTGRRQGHALNLRTDVDCIVDLWVW